MVNEWEYNIPEQKLPALKKWPKSWLTGENKNTFAQQYGKRKRLGTTFWERFVIPVHSFLLILT
jgi:hypothetical protein